MNSIIHSLANRQPLQSLSPNKVWDPSLDQQIQDLPLEQLAGGEQKQKPYALALKSALHLWNDSLDRSHTLSQNIHHETGSYWHGIMHRMEPDYSNAKYWFHKVGSHPTFERLQRKASNLVGSAAGFASLANGSIKTALESMSKQSGWNPYLFIDAIEMQESGEGCQETERILEKIQWLEIAILLQYTYKQSCGGDILEAI